MFKSWNDMHNLISLLTYLAVLSFWLDNNFLYTSFYIICRQINQFVAQVI